MGAPAGCLLPGEYLSRVDDRSFFCHGRTSPVVFDFSWKAF